MSAFIRRLSLHLVTAGVLWLGASVHAQCKPPDGLDNGLPCSQAFLSAATTFFKQPALGICWKDCGIDATANYTSTWGPPVPAQQSGWSGPACGWYNVRFFMQSGNVLKWYGNLRLVYARHWTEFAGPNTYEVYRFLANGDLTPGTGLTPCASPPCAAFFGRKVRFTGYVDYAWNCTTSLFEPAWMLTHACDGIDHDSGSARAGTFHPDRSYTLLGPSLGFNVGTAPTVEHGGSTVEAVRNWDVSTLPPKCRSEEPLSSGFCFSLSQFCRCGTGPSQWNDAALTGFGAFGSSYTMPIPGQGNFVSFAIGTWTNPFAYPAAQELRWDAAEVDYVDPCLGSLPRREYLFGVTTTCLSSVPVYISSSSTTTVLPRQFIDLSNSMHFPAAITTRNVQYWSDHVINLNL